MSDSKLMKLSKTPVSRRICECGLAKVYHSREALNKEVSKWDKYINTEIIYTWAFGNFDIPGHYNYLDTPEGTVS